jgi:hypothetical protein
VKHYRILWGLGYISRVTFFSRHAALVAVRNIRRITPGAKVSVVGFVPR